jgi:predicted XRE-type DNA-binding protein
VLSSDENTLAEEVSVVPLQDANVKEITSRLDIVIKLMAALFARDSNNNESIVKLNKMQLSRDQIANALGITNQNVSQVLYMSKKAEKKADRKSKTGDGEPTSVEAQPEAAATEEVQQ